MIFILGIIVGLLVACIVAIVYSILNAPAQDHIMPLIRQNLQNMNHRKGFIVEPESEADEARANIIAKNKAMGRDTPIDELR